MTNVQPKLTEYVLDWYYGNQMVFERVSMLGNELEKGRVSLRVERDVANAISLEVYERTGSE